MRPDLSDVPTDADIDTLLPENKHQFFQDLQLHCGKCPEQEKGIYCHLMKLALHQNKIKSILDSDNCNLMYSFNRVYILRAVGKHKWNEFSKRKLLHEFVTNADETLAMLIVEINVAKWMSEI